MMLEYEHLFQDSQGVDARDSKPSQRTVSQKES